MVLHVQRMLIEGGKSMQDIGDLRQEDKYSLPESEISTNFGVLHEVFILRSIRIAHARWRI